MTSVSDRLGHGLADATTRHRYGLLDTSVLIAEEQAWPLLTEKFPEYLYVSPVTLAELSARVLSARDEQTRERRQHTLDMVAGMTVLEITADVASVFASLLVQLAARGLRLDANHLWTAAVAHAYDVAVVTAHADLGVLADVDGPALIEV